MLNSLLLLLLVELLYMLDIRKHAYFPVGEARLGLWSVHLSCLDGVDSEASDILILQSAKVKVVYRCLFLVTFIVILWSWTMATTVVMASLDCLDSVFLAKLSFLAHLRVNSLLSFIIVIFTL